MMKTYEEETAEKLAKQFATEQNVDYCTRTIASALNEAVKRGISIGRNLEMSEWLACLEGKSHADKVITAIRERFPNG